MATKAEIYHSAAVIRSRVAELRTVIADDPELRRRGGVVFSHQSIEANLDPIFQLLSSADHEGLLTGDGVVHVADIGVGNGELSFMLSRSGYKVTAIDYADQYSQSPYIVSRIATQLDLPIAVVDFSIDQPFTMQDLKVNCVYDEGASLPVNLSSFDFTICVGLLYHLKNPFAFVESLARITRYCVLGTWIFTHLLPELGDVGEASLAYLLDDRELNDDPSNYWILSDVAIARLCQRYGFEVLNRARLPNNSRGIGTPNRMELLMRGFYLLRSTVIPAA